MDNSTLSSLYLLAFVSDPDSAQVIGELMQMRGTAEFRIEPGTILEATAYLKTNPSPAMLVVELPTGDPAPDLLDALADVVNGNTRVIVVGRTDTLTFYQWLMGLGIHDYLLAPLTEQTLEASLDKGNHPSAASEAAPHAKKLIGVIGARGGVGTTTIATNLAAIFAQTHSLPTGLIDLDPHFGSVALSLDLEPGRGMRDALEKPDRIDSLFLERAMVKLLPHLSILSAEEPLHEIALPHANTGPMLFTVLAEKFSVVVADLPRQMNPLTRHVLAHADQLVLVAEPQLLDLRDALRIHDYVTEQLKRPAPLLLINREGAGGGKHELSLGEITKHYGSAPIGHIPLLPEAFAANAQGRLLIDNPKLERALAPLYTMATRLSDSMEGKAADKKTGLRGLFKKATD